MKGKLTKLPQDMLREIMAMMNNKDLTAFLRVNKKYLGPQSHFIFGPLVLRKSSTLLFLKKSIQEFCINKKKISILKYIRGAHL